MRVRGNYNLISGLCLTAFMAAIMLLSAFWSPHDPNEMSAGLKMSAPSLSHLLGTDNFGRDILSRVLGGLGTTFGIAAATVAFGAAFGIVLGAATGYFGGPLDRFIMRLCDAVAAFPSILLALVIISLIGPGTTNVIITLGILFIPGFARITRGEFVKFRERDFVRSARLMGVSHLRLMFVHILPNTAPALLSAIAVGFNNAVLAEAGMSFLGLGVQPPGLSLGRLLSDSQGYFFSCPWYALSAGGAIVLLILGFGLISDGLI